MLDSIKEKVIFWFGIVIIILAFLVYLSGAGILDILSVLLGIIKFVAIVAAVFSGVAQEGMTLALSLIGVVIVVFDFLDNLIYEHTKMFALVLLGLGLLFIAAAFLSVYFEKHPLIKRKNTKKESTKEKSKPKEDTVFFGRFPRSADGDPEPVEWIILKKEGDRMLLLSNEILASKAFHFKNEAVTWETCSLRKWLNEKFYDQAFSHDEKEDIITSSVKAERNPRYLKTPAGKDTNDKLFLLSLRELEKYKAGGRRYKAGYNRYSAAVRMFWDETDNTYYGDWWLRTPGSSPNRVMNVELEPTKYGQIVDELRCGVRPAMWVRVRN